MTMTEIKKITKADTVYGDRGSISHKSGKYGVFKDGELVALIVNPDGRTSYMGRTTWAVTEASGNYRTLKNFYPSESAAGSGNPFDQAKAWAVENV